MVGLLDIAPVTATVKWGETEIQCRGVSVKGVAILLQDYPQFTALIAGGAIKPEQILSAAPELVAGIIAAGTGTPGNKEAQEKAADLPMEVQLDLLEHIIKMTMPSGPAPFLRRLTGLLNSIGAVSNANAGVQIEAPSTGKETATP
jgi:hypothetical protein